MRIARGLVGLALGVLLVAGAPGLGGTASAQLEPTLDVPGRASPGEEIRIRGEGWPASKLVAVETCGNAGRGGSTHCDQTKATTVSTSRDGVLTGFVTVGTPPSPCPCVIHAFVIGGAAQQSPIDLDGMPVAEPTPEEEAPVAALTVEAELQNSSSWTSWFGAAPERRLVLTLENTSDRTVSWAPLNLSWGRPNDPTRVIDAPDLEPLAAGESVRLEVAVPMEALAFGDYVVRGEVIGQPDASFSVRTSAHPWGLLALPVLLLVQVILVRARNALARAVQRRLPDAEEVDLAHEADRTDEGERADDGEWPEALEPQWDLEVSLAEAGDDRVLRGVTDPDPCSGREHEPA